MSRLLVGHIPAEYLPRMEGFEHGLDVKLDIWDDGTHEVAVRPGRGETWTTWGAPFILSPQSSEVE